jgi:single-stranded-DNA-specific exonuclease
MTRYTLAPEVPEAVAAELQELDPLLRRLLYTRGITTREDAGAFLEPSYTDHLHDPFLLHDMDTAVTRIMEALAEGERIAIYSDYDCDGIPGAVVLHDFFKAIGFSSFENYIPHRHYEGFGFNKDAAEKLRERGVTLIITIDCGTSDIAAIAHARSLGIDIIVTDHHEPKEELPEAVAVVNPKVGDTYPFDGLCGSGVVYKLVQALLLRNRETGAFTLTPGWEKWWLDMVAVATVADMVPLIGENRALAYYGLQVLRKSRRPGLQQLLRKQRAAIQHLTEDDIGFTIGPRINAASRMDVPEDAFFMLASSDEAEAGAYADRLEKLNNERRGAVAAMTREVHGRIEALEELPPVLVFGNPQWRPSLLGLVANKLAEEYGRPAFLWGRDGLGAFRGSCRSEGRTSVVALMDAVAPLFSEYGGHHMSGGFCVREDAIHSFPQALHDAFGAAAADFEETVTVDAELELDAVDRTFIALQGKLAPFGMGNPKPVYLFRNVRPGTVAAFGKTREHTKLLFETSGLAKEAIAFFRAPDSFPALKQSAGGLDLYAHVEQSFFMGRRQTRLRILDLR